MSLAIVYSRANLGVQAPLVTVEIHLSGGLPAFSIVGLPETVVKESKDRVRSAIINSRFDFPVSRITVNLAPADLPKTGGRFDLAIALGILAASHQLGKGTRRLKDFEFMGELALSGELRGVSGALPGLLACQKKGRKAIVARDNAQEAGLLAEDGIRLADTLLSVCAFLKGDVELPVAEELTAVENSHYADMQDVRGQLPARRALLIAAAGGHNLLMRGPPGTGKTMLASRLPGILPALDREQALEVAAVRSIAGDREIDGNWRQAPFRAPHHTASAVALVGGGATLNPGEISLAHHGVLFLDELPEFSPHVLEVMREPLESGQIMISRATYQVTLPARFQLVAAMNPCPCGYHGDRERNCRCTPDRIRSYQQRVSGPLLDRIDLHVDVPRLSREESRLALSSATSAVSESSASLREQVRQCQQLQLARQGKKNAHLEEAGLRQQCCLGRQDQRLLEAATQRMQLSIRAYFRILKITRTIADLAAVERPAREHLLEAIAYRQEGAPS